MFIRQTTHTNNRSGKKYHTYRLTESVRTQRGPRQRTVLNLGSDFNLPREKWKELANRIEAIVTGQIALFPVSGEMEQLAGRYARAIVRRNGRTEPDRDAGEPDFQTVDIDSLDNGQIRSVGGESVVPETIRQPGLDRKLECLGFNRPDIETAVGVIAARLLAPGSERATHAWLRNHTSLDDLMRADFSSLSQDRVYRVSDKLPKNKPAIEAHLRDREINLFNLGEKILLYDLTNTFFEGSGKYNGKARFGVSKEKRSDCRLVTLALLTDGEGFPKKSGVFPGNISEPGTLEKIPAGMFETGEKPPAVADAGIGTQKNVEWMGANGYGYIVVSRKRRIEIPADTEMTTVREDDRRVIRATVRTNESGETEICCHSGAKQIKEKGIVTRFERRFGDALAIARKALFGKYGTKKYERVLERIGRLKERYRRVAHRYEISVDRDEKTGKAVDIRWRMGQTDITVGYCVLRTNRTEFDEKKIFDIFTMLPESEDAFRSMKSELGPRPVHHQLEYRCDGHLFITVLAYHVLHTILKKLGAHGPTHSWSTIRGILSTHCRVTTSVRRSDGKMLRIRKTASPEECQMKIYDALGLPHRPGGITKSIL